MPLTNKVPNRNHSCIRCGQLKTPRNTKHGKSLDHSVLLSLLVFRQSTLNTNTFNRQTHNHTDRRLIKAIGSLPQQRDPFRMREIATLNINISCFVTLDATLNKELKPLHYYYHGKLNKIALPSPNRQTKHEHSISSNRPPSKKSIGVIQCIMPTAEEIG